MQAGLTRVSASTNVKIGLAALTLSLAGLIAGLLVIGAIFESLSVFGPEGDENRRRNLDSLSVANMVAIKAAHARQSQAYKVGLFGNSRAVEVSHFDIGLPKDVFFNFAVGGTAFPQSVAFLDYLVRVGKAPKLAIISLDNHDINFIGSMYWLPLSMLPGRMKSVVRTWSSHSEADAWKQAADHLRDWKDVTSSQLRTRFNAMLLKERLSFILFSHSARGQSSAYYLGDGARPQAPAMNPAALHIDRGGFTNRYANLVEGDIALLAEIQKKDVKVVVYESPIHPMFSNEVDHGRSNNTQEFRGRFFAACARYSITCLPAPILTGSLPWTDCCHPPPALLGRFIANLL